AKWAKSNGLAGIMMWSLDQDDFSGLGCQQGTYPLMKAVKRITETPRTETTSQSPNGGSNHQRYN
ncbi:chitotriosidase-1, partial [Biomphalaria glabrata]